MTQVCFSMLFLQFLIILNIFLLIVGAILVNIPYSLLIMNFDYPDILRLPTGEILTRFAAGGTGLIWTWLAFAWVGVPILVGILARALVNEQVGMMP